MFFEQLRSRRAFLRVSLFAAALTLLRRERGWARFPLPKENIPATLTLFNTHTGERVSHLTYRDNRGIHDPSALSRLDHLLRCHFTNEVHPIDPRTLDYLHLLDQALGGGHDIHIISAYRSPTYNDKLRREGHGVAGHSLHLQGRALDIRIPGIPLDRLKETALLLARGGVGYYPRSDFVHIDSGPVRAW